MFVFVTEILWQTIFDVICKWQSVFDVVKNLHYSPSGADVGISKVSKRYSPFNHWQDGQLGNMENQEQVHQRILEGTYVCTYFNLRWISNTDWIIETNQTTQIQNFLPNFLSSHLILCSICIFFAPIFSAVCNQERVIMACLRYVLL